MDRARIDALFQPLFTVDPNGAEADPVRRTLEAALTAVLDEEGFGAVFELMDGEPLPPGSEAYASWRFEVAGRPPVEIEIADAPRKVEVRFAPVPTTEALLARADEAAAYDIVLDFDQALDRRMQSEGIDALNEAERTVLAVVALEVEVNNGGYAQFFANASGVYAPEIVDALVRIGRRDAADLTRRAIAAHGVKDDAALSACSAEFYGQVVTVIDDLLPYIRACSARIRTTTALG
ncbi:MAG: DUF4375 domain-containing protein [Deltaproteobacteria bacterium]